MLGSKAYGYAVQALLDLAERAPRFCSIQEIAHRHGLPRHFLGRVLRTLTREGILQARKGPGGGVRLARPPEALTLYEIKRAIDGLDPADEEPIPCALDERGAALCAELRAFLRATTLADLLACRSRSRPRPSSPSLSASRRSRPGS